MTFRLTAPQLELLWRVAQHKYGWTYVSRHNGGIQVADALVRRGLVEYGGHDRDHPEPTIVATEAGRAELSRRYPLSPFVLDTYDPPAEGWTPKAGVLA